MTSLEGILTREEITAILSCEKFMLGDVEWNDVPPNSAFYQASFVVLDAEQKTIPGLSVELKYREGTIKGECKFQFTLYSIHSSKRSRVYQIEVVPPDKLSHRENGKKWYGPHQHFGEQAVEIDESQSLGCGDHESWFKVFLRVAKINHSGRYLPPGSPQGDLQW